MNEPRRIEVSLPEEPPIGTVIIVEKTGAAFQRRYTDQNFAEGPAWCGSDKVYAGARAGVTTWLQLAALAPLLVIWEPKDAQTDG